MNKNTQIQKKKNNYAITFKTPTFGIIQTEPFSTSCLITGELVVKGIWFTLRDFKFISPTFPQMMFMVRNEKDYLSDM